MKLTKNLTLKECTKSATAISRGIDNTPSPEVIQNIKIWAIQIFQPIRDHFEVPIGLNSMYRSPELNAVIGGAKSSQHTKGQAGDLDADIYGVITNRQIFEFVRDNLFFDQMIIYTSKEEPDFVHVSYVSGKENRNEILFKDSKGYHRI
jgi:zinc D-Ala-D-Ala carboxypeptidase